MNANWLTVVADWTGQAILAGTALAVLTWLIVRGPARGMKPAFHVALWTVVLIKFLVPAGPSSPLSLENLGDRVVGRTGTTGTAAATGAMTE